ncbi:MAG: hypothetical protein IRZ31_17975 [Thermogemmatispora sp.]|uniref:hypothetical protein n=1 Tax=Thermogemmatispora sp. TaxID=1968838 RepID=UPI002631D0E7|nr:hypothetical protein [Thermogemmatispora sp.]MBX5458784.1 hypothetical protein [Thermogemmatispora sp.]
MTPYDYDAGYALGREHATTWGKLSTLDLLRHLVARLEQAPPAGSGWLAERDRLAWVIGVFEGIMDGWQARPW